MSNPVSVGDDLVERREINRILQAAFSEEISTLLARATTAEAQLKAAREALDWYSDRVGLAGAMTEEGARARAELTQDNGERAALNPKAPS